MNVLLIAPPLFLESQRKIFPRFPPYIMLSTAASLENAGIKVSAYDAFLEWANFTHIKNVVEAVHPFLIGLCLADVLRFSPIEINIQLINFLKLHFPNIPITIFGIAKNSILQVLLANACSIDYVILGDPEETIVELVQCVDKKENTEHIQGLITRRTSGDFFITSSPRIISDLDRLFFPAWHLIGLNKYRYFPHRYKASKAYPIITSRGCPWKRCIFCKDISVFGSSPYRCRSPENVVSEIESVIKKNDYKEIQFYDSNFNTDIKWLNSFHEEIKNRHLSFRWSCLARVDNVSKEVLDVMRRAGCWNITFGIESSSQLLLNTIQKGINIEQIKKAVRWATESGIETTGSFLIGLPNEHPADIASSAKFAVHIGLYYAQFFITKWHEKHNSFQSLGILNEEWDYSQFDFRGRVFIPKAYQNFTRLKNMQRKAYLIFYFHPQTILRHIKKIKSMAEVKRLFLALLTLIKINMENPFYHKSKDLVHR